MHVRDSASRTRAYTAPAVVQAIRLLEEFGIDEPEHSLSELARRLGASKGTVHRLLMTLLDLGWVERNPLSDRYRLGLPVFQRGSVVAARMDVIAVGEPMLARLMAATEETVHLSVRDGLETLHVAKVESWQSIRMGSRVGKRAPLHCTGVGKVLLAWSPDEVLANVVDRGLVRHTENTIVVPDKLRTELADIRRRGYGLDLEERETGLCCVAAPIRNATGSVVAAVSASGPAQRLSAARIPLLAKAVVDGAAEISRQLGYAGATA